MQVPRPQRISGACLDRLRAVAGKPALAALLGPTATRPSESVTWITARMKWCVVQRAEGTGIGESVPARLPGVGSDSIAVVPTAA
jgi:hypothetical protein